MLVTVIATLCLAGGACTDKVVTDQATLPECMGPLAVQAIPQWLENNGYAARGYRLARWRCEIGKRTPA